MDNNWKTRTLGELAYQNILSLQTGPFGSQLHAHDYEPLGIRVVTTESIDRRKLVVDKMPYVSAETVKRLVRHILHTGDIVFARRGAQATGSSALVTSEAEGWLCGTGAIRLRIKNRAKLDPEYLSFYLSSKKAVAWLKSHAVGAVMPNLNESVLRRLPVVLPPFEKQRAIAQILGALDDKIELNRRMNQTLEDLTRAIFKSWFVDFDPVHAKARGEQPPGLDPAIAALFPDSFVETELGLVPKGWQVVSIEDAVVLKRDGIVPENYPMEEFDYYSIPAFDIGKPEIEYGENIKSNKYLVHPHSVLLSKLNPRFPRIWMPVVSPNRRAICSTEFFVCLPSEGISREFIYGLFSSSAFLQRFEQLVTGTSGSHQRVNHESFRTMKTNLASPTLIKGFTDLAFPLHAMMNANLLEVDTLTKLRDTLLPKLMSGELRVNGF